MKPALVAAAAIAWALAPAGDVAAQCMLANPSFEVLGSGGTVFAGWSQFGPVARSTTAWHGASSARVTGPNTGSWSVSGFWQPLDSAPGERWEASVWSYHAASSPLMGQSRAILNIEWRDAGDNLISYESHTTADAATPRDVWRVHSIQSQPAPEGTASIHFVLGVLQAPGDPTPQVRFDMATCVSLGPPLLDDLQWNDFPSGRTVSFSGRTWRVKGPGYYGPGPNLFDNGAGAVSVDAEGRLHMTIHKIGSSWYSSEVALVDPLGYGDYVFTTRGRVDLLDRNAVLGLFLWEYGSCYDVSYLWWNPYNEIDIEFSRWGSDANPNAQFVAQPAQPPGGIYRFGVAFGDSEVTSHAMRWLPQRVEYRSWRGGPDAESPGSRIASWTFSGANLPRPESPRVHINLWQLAAPAVAQEVVLESFTFRTACPADCGTLAVDPPAVASQVSIAAAPNPFSTETTFRYSTTAGGVDLSIFDVTGRRVRTLVAGLAGTGERVARWDGRNDAGERVAPGVYLCRLRGPHRDATRRVVVVP